MWLENALKRANFAWLCISHDRYFLEKLAEKIIEVSAIYPQKYFLSTGSYSDFLKQKSNFLSQQKNLKETLQTKLKKERQWLSQNPKARSTKQSIELIMCMNSKKNSQM